MSESSFAERLRRVFENNPDLKPASLATQAGLDNSAIRSILSGRVKNPRGDTMAKICAALGTTVADFMSGSFNHSELAADLETQQIRDLILQLSTEERRLLLGYAKGIRDARDLQKPEPPEDH